MGEFIQTGPVGNPSDHDVLKAAAAAAVFSRNKEDLQSSLDALGLSERLVALTDYERGRAGWLARLIVKFRPIGALRVRK